MNHLSPHISSRIALALHRLESSTWLLPTLTTIGLVLLVIAGLNR